MFHAVLKTHLMGNTVPTAVNSVNTFFREQCCHGNGKQYPANRAESVDETPYTAVKFLPTLASMALLIFSDFSPP
jgi:hypothetical protein